MADSELRVISVSSDEIVLDLRRNEYVYSDDQRSVVQSHEPIIIPTSDMTKILYELLDDYHVKNIINECIDNHIMANPDIQRLMRESIETRMMVSILQKDPDGLK